MIMILFISILSATSVYGQAPDITGKSSSPDEGKRVQNPNSGDIYLVLDGLRCKIPDTQTYSNLFEDQAGIEKDVKYDQIPIGIALSRDACIFKSNNSEDVYFSNNGQWRRFMSNDVFKQFHFDPNKVHKIEGSPGNFGSPTSLLSSNLKADPSERIVSIKNFSAVTARQQTGVWCWAACIQMVLNFNGINWTQSQVVEDTKGQIVLEGASIQEIMNFFPRWHVEQNGRKWYGDCFYVQGMPPVSMIITQLEINRPLIIGVNQHHVVILHKAAFVGGPNVPPGFVLPGGRIPQDGTEQIRYVVIFDPWNGVDYVVDWNSAIKQFSGGWFAWAGESKAF
jgi:hypothetical protein